MPEQSSMLCAVCSKPLGDAALCNLDEKWVHPDCEADAEWESESAAPPWAHALSLEGAP